MGTVTNTEDWVVVVVDDEYDNIFLLQKMLEHLKITVHTARNGQEALDILDELGTATFVLMDLSMPVMDGWKALEHIRKSPVYSDVPVIAVTAHAMRGDKQRALDVGFDAYVTKPFRPSLILSMIKDVIEV